ncbi:hypothetical protein OQA88_1120 [Cercophora sp. LCS_1]
MLAFNCAQLVVLGRDEVVQHARKRLALFELGFVPVPAPVPVGRLVERLGGFRVIIEKDRHENPLHLLQRFLENGRELSTLSKRHSNLPKAPCLYVAAYLGNTSAVKFLLDNKGVDVETRYHEPFLSFEKAALHAAAEQARCSVARVLIERGANVRAADKFGNSAIYYAAKSGRKSILQLLVSAGPSLS